MNILVLQMHEAAQYHFTTESIMLSQDNRPAISGITGREFQQRLLSMINTDPANTAGWPESSLAYDALWLVKGGGGGGRRRSFICRALALAFNCTLRSLPPGVTLEDFSYDNAIIADRLFECVRQTQFKGVSVRFDSVFSASTLNPEAAGAGSIFGGWRSNCTKPNRANARCVGGGDWRHTTSGRLQTANTCSSAISTQPSNDSIGSATSNSLATASRRPTRRLFATYDSRCMSNCTHLLP